VTARQPPIAPCPKGHKTVRVITNATGRMKRVDCCSCGWAGPLLDTERLAILAWNRRSSDAEAERRGAMAAVEWLAEEGFPSMNLRQAIERGEVLPGAKAKKGAKRT
jgi:hypothetical protein